MSVADNPSDQPTSTEEGSSVPGWLEDSVSRSFSALSLPEEKKLALSGSYLDCLTAIGRGSDVMATCEACHNGLMEALKLAGLSHAELETVSRDLEAIEDQFISEI
ncbi:MAG: hypothetical protein GX413_05950 [Acetobacter sp.]|jgi:hypothetical protein|nr:hypothetical protein [Acetobacter sp.]